MASPDKLLLFEFFFLGRLFAALEWHLQHAALCPPRATRFRVIGRLFRMLEQAAYEAAAPTRRDRMQTLVAEGCRRWRETYVTEEWPEIVAKHYDDLNRIAAEGGDFVGHHRRTARGMLRPMTGLLQALEASVTAGVTNEANLAFALGRRIGDGLHSSSVYLSLHAPGSDDPFKEEMTDPRNDETGTAGRLVVVCERHPGELGLSQDWLRKVQRLWQDLKVPGELPSAVPGQNAEPEECRAFVRSIVIAAEIGLAALEERQDSPSQAATVPTFEPGKRYFVKQQDFWLVQFDNETGRFKNLDGMWYIAYLLSNPHRLMAATTLYQKVKGVPRPGRSMAKPDPDQEDRPETALADTGMDEQGKKEIEQELAELVKEIDDARRENATVELKHLEDQFEFLTNRLKQEHDRYGRLRPIVKGDQNEQARSTVRQSMGRAYANMRKQKSSFAMLADYLETHIQPDRTSFVFRPAPDDPAWQVIFSS